MKICFVKGWARDKTLAERFAVSYMPITESGCWIWIAKLGGNPKDARGVINDGNGRKYALAHRVSWQLHYGEIPKGLKVCHRCDIGICVNPTHLFLGTQRDNLRDMVSKGRHAKQILTRADAEAIRLSAELAPVLARRYGVVEGVIYNVRARRSFQ